MIEVETKVVEFVDIQVESPIRFWPVYFHDGRPQCRFTLHSDGQGQVTVNDWARSQWFSREFLHSVNPWVVRYEPEVGGGAVTIEVDNGKAVYELVEAGPDGFMRGELVSAEIDMPVGKLEK